MTVLTSIAGWAAFGLTARMYALGIQKRPLLDGIGAHFAVAGAFGALGYFIHQVQERQINRIHDRKQVLLDRRAQRKAATGSD
jgi:hypothetical protein